MKLSALHARSPRLPHLALGALTVITFAGPFSLLIVRGGNSETWPPDRPVEWFVVIAVPALACILMLVCLSLPWWYPPDRWHQTPSTGPKPG
jgi:hypothetical protein